MLGQIIMFDLEKQHAQKTSNTHLFLSFLSTTLFPTLIFRLLNFILFSLENIETANKDTRATLDETSKSLSTLSNLLVALLHPWSFDKNADQLCEKRLHLKRINRFLSYGILSKNDHLTIVLPTWQQHLNDNIPETFLPAPPKLISFSETDVEDEETLKQYVFETNLSTIPGKSLKRFQKFMNFHKISIKLRFGVTREPLTS